MRKSLIRSLLVIGISATTISAYAQPAIPRKYVENPGVSVGMNFGLSDLWGDVGTQSVIDHYGNERYWSKPHFMGGIFMRFCAHPSLAFRINLNYGTLYANDDWNINKAKEAKSVEDDAFQRYLRNQDARANVWESTVMFEIMPLRFNSESKMANKKMQPYIAFGAGAFHYRPQTSLIDPLTGHKKWVYTKDLKLEGEGLPNSNAINRNLWQLCVPVGAGLRWNVGKQMNIGVEWSYRLTTTDRLDNVSSVYLSPDYYDRYLDPKDAAIAKQVYDKSWYIEPSYTNAPGSPRGNKDVLDGYSTFSIQLIYRLESNKIPWWY
ncbi:MAG: hypothetical protein KDC07_09180 [Chitinophagaceae bacterium]|nr:hypothetical protein [Chitinophagaceae bacterium]MCB9044546.1 hypothetical protein [Chitinophagales bacterium]